MPLRELITFSNRAGRWRSEYTVDLNENTVQGRILVTVHYYEQGNVGGPQMSVFLLRLTILLNRCNFLQHTTSQYLSHHLW